MFPSVKHGLVTSFAKLVKNCPMSRQLSRTAGFGSNARLYRVYKWNQVNSLVSNRSARELHCFGSTTRPFSTSVSFAHGSYEMKDPASENEVVNITYIDRDGKPHEIRGKVGDNVLYLAHRYDRFFHVTSCHHCSSFLLKRDSISERKMNRGCKLCLLLKTCKGMRLIWKVPAKHRQRAQLVMYMLTMTTWIFWKLPRKVCIIASSAFEIVILFDDHYHSSLQKMATTYMVSQIKTLSSV